MDTSTFFKIIDVLGVDVSLKERKKYEWTFAYVEKEGNEKAQVIMRIYEENECFSLEVFESIDGEKGKLLMVNSQSNVQGECLSKTDIDWIIEQEVKEQYAIEQVEYLTFDEVEVPTIQSGNLHTFSVSMIERSIRKMLFEKYKKDVVFSFTLDPEWGSPECAFGIEDETNEVLLTLLNEYDPANYRERAAVDYLEEVLRSNNLEELRTTVKSHLGAYAARKKSDESEEAYQKRLIDEIQRFKYDSFYLDDFRERVVDLLLGSLLNKQIVHYQQHALYHDLIYITTK